MGVDWDAPAESLMLCRDVTDGVSVLIRRISKSAHAFLHALQTQATLEGAAAAALELDAVFDLQGLLLESLQSGVIIDVNVPN